MATKLYFHNALTSNTGNFNRGQVYSDTNSGIVYGNGIYIKGNDTGYQRSTNGISWESPNSFGLDLIYGLAFGNGYFMAADRVGVVLRSTDGNTWTQVRDQVGNVVVQNLVYAGDYWFLCANGGQLSYATGDGSTWTTGDPGSFTNSGTYYWATYESGSGTYVISGADNVGGAIRTATIPSGTWSTVTAPSINSVKVITYNSSNALWIVGTTSTSATANVYTTPTLSATPTWTSRTLGGAAAASNWWIMTGGSVTVLLGTGVVTSSSNGTSFTNYNDTGLTPTFTNQTWYTGVYDGTYFYALSTVGIIMRSTDGANWTRVSGPLSNTTESIGPEPLAIPNATAYSLRSMNTTIGVSQASLALTTAASATAQNNFVGFFCSEPLLGAQTVGGGTVILNGADAESNLNSNWWMNGLCIYVWRPSTGTLVGYVRDYQGTPVGGTEPTAAATEQVTNITGITTSAVSAQNGDVIICEIWVTATQGMATAYTGTFYYDGTTENTTENATVTSQASFIEFTENLVFGVGPEGNTGNMFLMF